MRFATLALLSACGRFHFEDPSGDASNRPCLAIELAPTTFSAPSANAIDSADFDGDGILDLVITEIQDQFHFMRGDGAGGFAAPVAFRTGRSPFSIASGDFESNGTRDVVVADRRNFVASVSLGNGNGTFVANVDYGAGGEPWGIAVGDLDNDLNPDVVVGATTPGDVAVLRGRGDSTFDPMRSVAGVTGVTVAIADLDRDGRQDVLATDPTRTAIAVLLGNGDATLQNPVFYVAATRGELSAIAVEDLDHDDKLDVVTTTLESELYILRGNGDGTLQAPIAFPTAQQVRGVALVDFNDDGNIDVAILNQFAATVSVMMGYGDGGLQAARDFPTENGPISFVAGDFDRDGRVDLAAPSFGAQALVVLRNTTPASCP